MTDNEAFEKPPPYSPYPEPGTAPFNPSHQWTPMANPTANVPNYGSTVIVQQQPRVIIIGGCPACRVGILEDDFSCLGIFMAVVFFPIGLLCCLAMRQRRCPNCGAVFE